MEPRDVCGEICRESQMVCLDRCDCLNMYLESLFRRDGPCGTEYKVDNDVGDGEADGWASCQDCQHDMGSFAEKEGLP